MFNAISVPAAPKSRDTSHIIGHKRGIRLYMEMFPIRPSHICRTLCRRPTPIDINYSAVQSFTVRKATAQLASCPHIFYDLKQNLYAEKKVASNNFLQIVINTSCQMLSIFGNTSRWFFGSPVSGSFICAPSGPVLLQSLCTKIGIHTAVAFSAVLNIMVAFPPILRCSLTVSPLMPMLLQPFSKILEFWTSNAMRCYELFWCVRFVVCLVVVFFLMCFFFPSAVPVRWKVLSE